MMGDYQATIGLEVHAELKTRTKMFCDSLNDPDEKHPNVNVCPVCLAHPGTLPVANRRAIEHMIRVGLALDGTINAVTKFDRKNYFYPDLPKGYQISQYDQPLVLGRGVAEHSHHTRSSGRGYGDFSACGRSLTGRFQSFRRAAHGACDGT